MANTKISQLPSYTGTAADLRWFVMNNSGQTETFKFSGFTSPFRPSNGTNSFVNYYDDITDTTTDYQYIIGGQNNTMQSASVNSAMVSTTNSIMNGAGNNFMGGGSNNNMAYNWRSAIIGGADNTCQGGYVSMFNCGSTSQNASNSSGMAFFNCFGTSTNGNFYNYGNFIGAVSCYVGNNDTVGGFQGSIFGSYSSKIADTSEGSTGKNAYPILIGGFTNKILGDTTTKSHNSIYNGSGNTITQSQSSTIIGTYNTTISSSSFSAIIGGKDNVLNLATGSTISAGNSCSIIGDSIYSGILGGLDNDITSAGYSTIIGGTQNYMSGASESGIFAGFQNTNNGSRSAVIGGQGNSISNTLAERDAIIASYQSSITGNTDQSFVVGGNHNSIGASEAFILGGNYSQITGGGNNEIIGSKESTITGGNDVSLINTLNSNSASYDRVVMLGTSGRTSTTSSATFVENLVVFNYSNLNYADDTAAAAGGVVLGQIYHTAGALKIRIT